MSESADLVMCPDREQQDRLGALVLHELENDAQVIGGAARPTAGQIALELVRRRGSNASAWSRCRVSRRSGSACGRRFTNRLLARMNAADWTSGRFTTRSR